MSDVLIDLRARERFRDEWRKNFAVSANAGSGKTTAISERLAAMAMSAEAAELLPKTAVVTFTKKAAQQIGQRARAVLMRRLSETGRGDLSALDHLERAFFGTIHSFCLLLAQRYGQTLGIHLNPTVVADDDAAQWEAFLEQDAMQFTSLTPEQVDGFLRHAPLETIFELARELDRRTAEKLRARRPAGAPTSPTESALQAILDARSRGKIPEALKRNQDTAVEWLRRFRDERTYLPLAKPDGTAAGIKDLYADFFAPLKNWLAAAGGALAAELAERYRAWRFERGVQTYSDQIETAMAVLRDAEILEKIRTEGWRVILDEAQDTDPQQFAVLVEIARAPGVALGTWPAGGGAGPRAGHFCMVGDGQQAIYGSRADIRNFTRHVEAFRRGDGGELLEFQVTFRTPKRAITLLNTGFPEAFGTGREHNVGLPPAEGAPAPTLQVPYQALEAGPANVEGHASRLKLTLPGDDPGKVDAWLVEEVRQLGRFFKAHGPAGVGARSWGEVCLLAPRNDWLITVRKTLESEGLKVALQMRKNRNGDNPMYAWMSGLLAAVCDPDNAFEWFGVLREVFAVSDAQLAAERVDKGGFRWDEPGDHPEPLRGALEILRPWVLRVDDEGGELERFASGLAEACGLRAKARLVDPSGGLEAELERLLAEAATLGLDGAGPREWLAQLLAALDDGRPAGKPEADAINLLTAHSAKGLEWPVVIPLGLWRPIGKPPESGLRLIMDATGEPKVFFDGASLPDETGVAREREQHRELVRLLYVTLTRARQHLVIPWNAEFGGKRKKKGEISFAELWGVPELWTGLPALSGAPLVDADARTFAENGVEGAKTEVAIVAGRAVNESGARLAAGSGALDTETLARIALPGRLLPHQLAEKPHDPVRTVRHESSLDEPAPARERNGDEAIDYGLWWHETVEFMPWTQEEAAVADHCAKALLGAAALGLEARGKAELALLRGSEVWQELRSMRWSRLTELAIFAPLGGTAWIDGVMDLVLHDAVSGEVWVLDWKTNRRRAGETDEELLARLVAEYSPQLQAYGRCVRSFFPGRRIRLLVYASVAGKWADVAVT